MIVQGVWRGPAKNDRSRPYPPAPADIHRLVQGRATDLLGLRSHGGRTGRSSPSLVISAVGSEAREPISPVLSWEGDGPEPSSGPDRCPLLQSPRYIASDFDFLAGHPGNAAGRNSSRTLLGTVHLGGGLVEVTSQDPFCYRPPLRGGWK